MYESFMVTQVLGRFLVTDSNKLSLHGKSQVFVKIYNMYTFIYEHFWAFSWIFFGNSLELRMQNIDVKKLSTRFWTTRTVSKHNIVPSWNFKLSQILSNGRIETEWLLLLSSKNSKTVRKKTKNFAYEKCESTHEKRSALVEAFLSVLWLLYEVDLLWFWSWYRVPFW